MKLSRECHSEQQARTLEAALQASGYSAWCKQKSDGEWEVFWFVKS
jgi:hypothetical protein